MAQVTVVILSHRPALLPRAVASVLAQTVPCGLVVQHAAEYWPDKLNDGIRASRGEWVVPLCDDDTLDPEFVARTLAVSHGQDVVYTDRRVCDVQNYALVMAGMRSYVQPSKPWSRVSFQHNCPCAITALIRREFFESIGGYDGHQPFIEYDFWYRCWTAGARAFHLAGAWWNYYEHAQNSDTMDFRAAMDALWGKHPDLEPERDMLYEAAAREIAQTVLANR